MSDPAHSAANAAQREHRRHSISAKIVFLVFLCTFSTALVVSGIAIQSSYEDRRGEIDRGFPAALERGRNEMTFWLAEGDSALREFASSPSLDSDEQRAKGALADFVTHSLHFDAAALLTSGGEWVHPAAGLLTGDQMSLAGSLEAGQRAQRLTLPGDPPAALAVVPLTPGRGSDGFLVGRYDRSLLDALLQEERRGVSASLVLTDAEGHVLAAAAGLTGVPEGLDRAIGRLEAEAPGVVREYANAAGVHTLGALLPLSEHAATLDGDSPDPANPWALVVEAPFTTAFARMIELVIRVFVIDLVLSLVFIAAAYRITARMLGPIEDLSQGARLASAGNFGQAISDPGTHDEIGRLTRAFNEMMGKLHESQSDLQEANRQLQSRNEELQRANEVLNQLSITDGLTKLHNHRYFQESLVREIKRQSRTAKPLSVLLVDLDDFKALNDRLGHASGDELLARVASIMDTTVRESDLLARYGGEEFVVLATDTDLEGAVQLAEKIRMAVEQARHIVNESLRPVRITVSVGVAQYAGNRRRFFEAADRALYRAKDQGKNCVVAADDDGPLE